MNLWQLALTVLAGIIVVAAVWGWLEERRFRRHHRIGYYIWPLESDGVEFPEWVNDRDWDLAAKLEVYEADQ